ncbi:MAG: hypothetical protein EPN21_17940 [Methylococcaceae bacterium]|nr:MAG: hypothetical protein EPN21_17940 [Methylococcaceae bacterium]
MNHGASDEPWVRLRDNPILLAQGRRRLRRGATIPMVAVVALLALCGLLAVATLGDGDKEAWRQLIHGYLSLIGIILLLFGAPQVGNTLVDERAGGILDFHRATPLRPMTLALGYLLGCPAREYAVAVAVLPFLALALVWAPLSLFQVAAALLVLVTSTWFFHAFFMLTGLVMDFSRRQSGMVTLVLLVLMLGFSAGSDEPIGFALYLTPLPALLHLLAMDDAPQWAALSAPFFGWRIDPVLYTLLLQGALTAFLLEGCTRRLQNETVPAFSRGSALGLFVVLLTLGVGSQWQALRANLAQDIGGHLLVFLVTATLMSTLLLLTLAPSYLNVVRGLRRARRRGAAEVSWWQDGAAGWPLALAYTLLTATGLGVWLAGASGADALDLVLSRMFFAAVFAQAVFLAFVVGALEYVRLLMRSSWRNAALLIAFCAFILPWLLMGVLSGISEKAGAWPLIFSPLSGLIATWSELSRTWAGGQTDFQAYQAAADIGLGVMLLPSMLAAAWFFYRCRQMRRLLAEAVPLQDGA